MEIKAKITVKIATGDGATTIIDGTIPIAIATGTTTGGGEFRGLTNPSGIWKRRGKVLENCQLAFPDRASLSYFLPLRLILSNLTMQV